MPRLSLWNQRKQNDYKFMDRTIREMYFAGGTAVNVHLYKGPVTPSTTSTEVRDVNDLSQPNYEAETGQPANETNIQDLLLLENRDRRYDPNIYELRGVYQVNDNDFSLAQFGLFLTNDTIFLTFHLNDMVAKLGRKLISGDVLELPHLREDLALNPDTPAFNKFYVITDANRAAEGFSPTWYPHIWRVKCEPVNNQQEFYDILNRKVEDYAGDLLDLTLEEAASTLPFEIKISDTVQDEAARQIPLRNYTHYHLYLDPCRNTDQNVPVIQFGDGVIPNGTIPVNQGAFFPENPTDGDWFLRTDYEPYVLFERKDSMWVRREADWRKTWSQANRVLETFINNRGTFTDDSGREQNNKQYISKALKPNKPKPDFS